MLTLAEVLDPGLDVSSLVELSARFLLLGAVEIAVDWMAAEV